MHLRFSFFFRYLRYLFPEKSGFLLIAALSLAPGKRVRNLA
jgi:hypothetical protein